MAGVNGFDADRLAEEARLSGYVDGELERDEARAVAERLAADDALRAEAAALRRVGELGRLALAAPPVADAEWGERWQAIDRQRRAGLAATASGASGGGARVLPLFPRLLAAVAAALLVTAVVVPFALERDEAPRSGGAEAPWVGGELMTFDDRPGANRFELLDMASHDDYMTSIMLPQSDDDPVHIMVRRL